MAAFWPIRTAQIIRIVSYPIRKKSRFWLFCMWSVKEMYHALLPNTDYRDKGRGHDRRLQALGSSGHKKKRAREKASCHPSRVSLACLPRARPFSLSPTTSKRLLRRLVTICLHPRAGNGVSRVAQWEGPWVHFRGSTRQSQCTKYHTSRCFIYTTQTAYGAVFFNRFWCLEKGADYEI